MIPICLAGYFPASTETAGDDIIQASDGSAATERYFLAKPDLVLLDLPINGMYGLEVLDKLRYLDAQARVIVASADVQSFTHNQVKAAAAEKALRESEAQDRHLVESNIIGIIIAYFQGKNHELIRTQRLNKTTVKKAMESIERNANNQVKIIDDILDASLCGAHGSR